MVSPSTPGPDVHVDSRASQWRVARQLVLNSAVEEDLRQIAADFLAGCFEHYDVQVGLLAPSSGAHLRTNQWGVAQQLVSRPNVGQDLLQSAANFLERFLDSGDETVCLLTPSQTFTLTHV